MASPEYPISRQPLQLFSPIAQTSARIRGTIANATPMPDTTQTEPIIVLSDATDFPLSFWITQNGSEIMSSVTGATPTLNLTSADCFKVDDKVFVAHTAGDCNKGLYGCGKITAISGNGVTVVMADGSTLDEPGGQNGVVYKAQNLQGWAAILAIYSTMPQQPSPPNLEGAIDLGSKQLLIKEHSVNPGDKVWLPEAGLVGATVLAIQSGTKGGKNYTIATVSQAATASVSPTAPKSLRRVGQILSYTKLNPSGDGSCGLLEGYIDRRDILGLPSAESCDCNPCAPTREVGCYQLLVFRGGFNTQPGYAMYWADQQFIASTGKIYIAQSIAPQLAGITL